MEEVRHYVTTFRSTRSQIVKVVVFAESNATTTDEYLIRISHFLPCNCPEKVHSINLSYRELGSVINCLGRIVEGKISEDNVCQQPNTVLNATVTANFNLQLTSRVDSRKFSIYLPMCERIAQHSVKSFHALLKYCKEDIDMFMLERQFALISL